MKKLLFLAVICLLGFYGCKKDSDDNSKKIIGKWTHVKAVLIKNVNGVDSVDQVDDHLDPDEYLLFNKNGTAVSHSNGEDENANYTLSGNTLSITTADSLSITLKIKTLTSKSLVLRQQEDFGQNGATYYSEDYYSK